MFFLWYYTKRVDFKRHARDTTQSHVTELRIFEVITGCRVKITVLLLL